MFFLFECTTESKILSILSWNVKCGSFNSVSFGAVDFAVITWIFTRSSNTSKYRKRRIDESSVVFANNKLDNKRKNRMLWEFIFLFSLTKCHLSSTMQPESSFWIYYYHKKQDAIQYGGAQTTTKNETIKTESQMDWPNEFRLCATYGKNNAARFNIIVMAIWQKRKHMIADSLEEKNNNFLNCFLLCIRSRFMYIVHALCAARFQHSAFEFYVSGYV